MMDDNDPFGYEQDDAGTIFVLLGVIIIAGFILGGMYWSSL